MVYHYSKTKVFNMSNPTFSLKDLEKMLQEKFTLQPESLYAKYMDRFLLFVFRAYRYGNFIEIVWDKDRSGKIVGVSGEFAQIKAFVHDLAKKIMIEISCDYDYKSAQDIFDEFNKMPFFAHTFSFQEVLNTLKSSYTFSHAGLVFTKAEDSEPTYYLDKMFFNNFLAESYDDLYEKYLQRKNPWLSVERLTNILNGSYHEIREALTDMYEKNFYTEYVRFEQRGGEYVPFLNPEAIEIFRDYFKNVYSDKHTPLQYRDKSATLLPNVRFAETDRYDANFRLQHDIDGGYRICVPETTKRNNIESVPSIATKSEATAKIIRSFIQKNEALSVEPDTAKKEKLMGIIMNLVDSLARHSDFIRSEFKIDVAPLVAQYKSGKKPSVDEIKSFLVAKRSSMGLRAKSMAGHIK